MTTTREIIDSLASSEHDGRGRTLDALGVSMFALAERLYPICRSITGQGLRESLSIVNEYIPLDITEVPTGTQVFDWTIPKEWNIHEAFVEDANGNKVVDFAEHNLHVVNYSAPVDTTLPLDALRARLHTLPEHPDWIPYRTAYYNEDWGFCLTHRQLESLPDGEYRVFIDSSLEAGALTYAEALLPGKRDDEILLFAHCCHPSLANDNLAGVVVLTALGELLRDADLEYSIRLIFAPATIGSITWLARNEEKLWRIKAGLVASVLGDDGYFRYKKTRAGDTQIDRASQHVLSLRSAQSEILDFLPWGYDERQFGSPGVNLPIGRLTRSPNGEYPEYHTSADDLNLISAKQLAGSLLLFLEIIDCIESDRKYMNLAPMGEPQLGKRGLYSKMGGFQTIEDAKLAMLWMLNQSDGAHSLLEIAEQSGMSYRTLAAAAATLVESSLLREIQDQSGGRS